MPSPISRPCWTVLIPLLAAARLLAASDAAAGSPPAPEWIWLDAVRDHQGVYFRKTFSITGEIESAVIAATCDNSMVLFLNGKRFAEHEEWAEPLRESAAGSLKTGENVIEVRARNREGPAGLLVYLLIRLKGGGRQVIVTDRSWQVAPDGDQNWLPIDPDVLRASRPRSLGKLGVAPWGTLEVDPEVTPRARSTPPEAIQVPEGFQVDLLYAVPRSRQGSWVCMTPLPDGRLICSDQGGALYRVAAGSDADSTRVERLAVSIGEAQGLLWARDSLYVAVNGGAAQGSGLYRVLDSDGDGELDEVRLLKKLRGGGEHGPHAIRLGPDGKLYLLAGNHTDVPAGISDDSPHRGYAEDLLLPRNPDGNGHATGRMAPGGWIARIDLDRSTWELFCGGFRNPYDIAFNTDGELFTYDADMEWDTGTPWYRPTRVNHAVSAAEFGWRYGTGKWPAYYPDSVGAVVDIGLGSPTGIEFGTGAHFPARYQRALFINDWTHGKIYAVHLKPEGASYTATFETFVSGKPLPVTDIAVHPLDGALYFLIGGRGTQSGLYRIRYTGGEAAEPASAPADAAAAAARALRRELESFHAGKHPGALEAAWPRLGSADRSIRYAARIAVERQPVESWRERALGEENPAAAIQALLALARTGAKELQRDVIDRLNRLPLERLSEDQILDALRVYQLAFIRLGGRGEKPSRSALARLDPMFPHPSDAINRELCQLLVYLEAPRAAERALELLRAARTQEEQMFYAFTLRNLKGGWTLDERRAYFGWLNLAESRYRGGASFKRFIQQIRADALAKLPVQDRESLREVIEERRQVEAVALETTRQFVHNWQMEDLDPILDQVERGRSFERGRAAYEATQCSKCHRFAGDGGATGPDITDCGARFTPRYLLESLITPSAVISDQYQNWVIVTSRGEVVIGRVIDESAERLLVRAGPFARDLIEVPAKGVRQRRPSSTSEMPAGLINVLSREEVLDLIAYLRSGGNSGDRAFAEK